MLLKIMNTECYILHILCKAWYLNLNNCKVQSETLAPRDSVKEYICSIYLGVHLDMQQLDFLFPGNTQKIFLFNFDGCKENISCYPHKAMNTPFRFWESLCTCVKLQSVHNTSRPQLVSLCPSLETCLSGSHYHLFCFHCLG